MLKGSLEGQIGADTKDMEEEKSTKAANEEQKATDSGDLAMTEKDLAEAQASLAKISHDCLQTAANHEATVASREEELKVIATAKKISKGLLRAQSRNRMFGGARTLPHCRRVV